MTRASLAFAAALAMSAFAPGARASDQTQFYLSWHAPFGAPGATTDLSEACGDTTREDTLCITCDVGTDAPNLDGFTSTLLFHAQIGDTLGAHWRFGRGHQDLRNVRALWSTDSTLEQLPPWKGLPGFGGLDYDYSSGTGTLRILFAVPMGRSQPIKYGDRVCLARLLIRRPPSGVPECGRPLCIEWTTGTLALLPGYEPKTTRGARFVTLNSPGGAPCEPFRGPARVRPWKPPGTRGESGPWSR
jgi:hypothetical protein